MIALSRQPGDGGANAYIRALPIAGSSLERAALARHLPALRASAMAVAAMIRWLIQFLCGLRGHGGWRHLNCDDPANCDCTGWWICKRCGKLEDFHADF